MSDDLATPTPAESFATALETAEATLTRHARAAKALTKTVSKLRRAAGRLETAPKEVLDTVETVRKVLAALEPIPDLAVLLDTAQQLAQDASERARLRFGTALSAALREKLGPESPPLHPLDVGFELGAVRILPAGERFALEYAKVPVRANLPADPEAVADAVVELLASLDRPPFEADAFLERLHAAYQHCLRALGKNPGELLDILELWRRLVLELQSDAFRRDPSARRFRDYPTYRFAHDLWRLRLARKFELAGHRLELQTAVHDRAYGKALWVPGDQHGGAYYQSLGFR